MTLHGLLRITTQIQRGPSLKDKPKWLHGEEPGLRCPQEHGWLQNVLENMQNAAKRRRGAGDIAESSGIVSAERQTSEDLGAGAAQLLRAHGPEAGPARDRC